MEISEVLRQKIDCIIHKWVEAVRRDGDIESTQELTYQAIQDSVPYVLEAIADLLENVKDPSGQILIDKSLEHGTLRAKQGFDAEEVAREYRLLRQVIFSTLEPELLQSSAETLLWTTRLIDTTLDEVISQCFQSYTQSRLSEVEQIQSQLLMTNQELERLVSAQQDNLSRLTHELKSPLTSIIGYSDLFLRQKRKQLQPEDGSSTDLKSIERVLQGGRRLLHIINDALEIARYRDGKIQLEPQPVQICGLIHEIAGMFDPLATEKGLTLAVFCDLGSKNVAVTDPLRLQQILTNLISNAVRYTESGQVKVTCQAVNDEQFAIAVSDTGIGIDPEDQAHVFEPYYQSKQSARLPDSTGLGLAIVAQLVELLQGKIQLISELGFGTTVTVTLPFEIPEPADLASIPRLDKKSH
jgi:signal transduction histidine kinase